MAKKSLGECWITSAETREKISLGNKGKIVSAETKYRMSKSHKGKPSWNKGIPHTIEHRRKLSLARRKHTLPVKDTSIEVKIQNFLKELNIKFIKHKYIKDINHSYQCDVFIEPNIVIECDGDYWHKYPNGNEIDKIRTKEMLNKNYKVIRLWECNIRKMSIIDFQNILNLATATLNNA